MTPSGVHVRKPTTPTTAKPSPTSWANCGGLASSSSDGGRLGIRLQIAAYGLRPAAPRANTTAWRASRVALCVSRTTASTAEVIQAANRGPRGSIIGSPSDGRAERGQVRRTDTGSRRRGRSPPRASSPGPTWRSSYGFCERRDDLLFPGLPGRPLGHPALRVEDERRGGLEHVEPAHEVQVGLRVEVDVRDAGDDGGDVAEDALGGPTRGAERARELQEGGSLAGGDAEVGEDGQQAVLCGGHRPDAPLARFPGQAERDAQHEDGCEDPHERDNPGGRPVVSSAGEDVVRP